jgi:tetratricopeptide (TPR) repeat protein
VIRLGASLVESAWAKPLRALTVLVVALVLAIAGVNLWAWQQWRAADRLAGQQRFTRAYTSYSECLKVWRWSASVHFLASRTARRAGQYRDAEVHLAECARLQGEASGTSVPLALESLLLRAESEDVGDVEEVLWGYVQKNTPDTPLILEALARGYRRMLRLGTAFRCLRLLLERQPDNVEGLVQRGWIQEGGGEPDEAVKDYRRALQLNPERDDARLGLARILVHDNPKEACSHFEQVVARQPGNVDALEGLAGAYWALGKRDEARRIHEVVLNKDPGNSKALAGMGVLAMAAGNTSEGESLLRQAIASDPANAEAHYQLYLCLIQQPGRKAEAAAQQETHSRVEADRVRLAQIASREMTRAPNDPNLHSEMGIIYLRYGKPDVGIRWLYGALRLDPSHQPTHQALYEYFKRTGQLEMAERHHKEIRPVTTKSPPARP